MHNEKPKKTFIPSLVTGAEIIETIKTDAGNMFCVGNAAGFRIVPEFEHAGRSFLPIPSDSTLITQGIITFPEAPLPYESEEALHREIKDHISRYLSVSADFLEVLSAYVMLSWVYDAFNELPYLRIQGDFGSGKTRALLVSGSLCSKSFNASGASTISPIFHILDRYQGTLVLDEADFRFSDEQSEIVKILNNGNQKGFPVLRSMMNARKEFEPRAFSVFGPKIIAMRGSYDDVALESRFLTENMNGRGRGKGIPSQLPKEIEEEAAHLRRKLLTYRLQKRFAFEGYVHRHIEGLPDRVIQIASPLLAVAPSEAARAAILRVAQKSADSLSVERGWSFQAEVLKALVSVLEKEGALTVSGIASALRLQTGREFDRSLSNSIVGRALRDKLGLKLYKSRGLVTIHPGQDGLIEKLRDHYGV